MGLSLARFGALIRVPVMTTSSRIPGCSVEPSAALTGTGLAAMSAPATASQIENCLNIWILPDDSLFSDPQLSFQKEHLACQPPSPCHQADRMSALAPKARA